MGRQNRREPILIENIEIIDTANKGKSVAKHEGRAIFVQGGVPGDICDITVFKRRKKFWEARIEKIHTYSDRRTEPKCEHFGTCGGCKWQNMKYASQLDFKQNEVLNNLKRIGGIELPPHSEKLVSEN
jgi:23S rRNA (uracil1939-C5)-methyltransferase